MDTTNDVTEAPAAEFRLSDLIITALAGFAIGLIIAKLNGFSMHLAAAAGIAYGVIGYAWAFFVLGYLDRLEYEEPDSITNLCFQNGHLGLLGLTLSLASVPATIIMSLVAPVAVAMMSLFQIITIRRPRLG